jgi:hypothetical protein
VIWISADEEIACELNVFALAYLGKIIVDVTIPRLPLTSGFDNMDPAVIVRGKRIRPPLCSLFLVVATLDVEVTVEEPIWPLYPRDTFRKALHFNRMRRPESAFNPLHECFHWFRHNFFPLITVSHRCPKKIEFV